MSQQTLKQKLYTIIFGWETPAGRAFDVALIVAIILSVIVLMTESLSAISSEYYFLIRVLEWIFTVIFTVEYTLRIYCSPNRKEYVTSFYGVIDLVSILPSYLSLIVPGANFLLVVRLMRFLRIFRILKLVRYLSEANTLFRSMMLARRKISVFFLSVFVLTTIFGSVMYVVEGPQNGFTSIPKSIYWTIVTITTVGFGDMVPKTVLGQFIACLAMLVGYSIIAIPTGIFTAELAQEIQRERINSVCENCGEGGHERDSRYCKACGAHLGE